MFARSFAIDIPAFPHLYQDLNINQLTATLLALGMIHDATSSFNNHCKKPWFVLLVPAINGYASNLRILQPILGNEVLLFSFFPHLQTRFHGPNFQTANQLILASGKPYPAVCKTWDCTYDILLPSTTTHECTMAP